MKVSQSYLRFLVQRIVVNERRIDIVSRSSSVASLMAAGEGKGSEAGHETVVLTSDPCLLPDMGEFRTAVMEMRLAA